MTDRSRLEHALVENHPAAMTIGLVLWIIGGSLFVIMANDEWAAHVQSIDDAVWRWVVDHENDVFVALAKAADFLGSSWVLTPLIIGIGVWLAWKRWWMHLAGFASAMLVSQLLIGPVKVLYARPRPPDAFVETTSWSFPSGHSLATAALVVALVFILVPAGARRTNLAFLAALIAVLMAMSRVYLRAHWLTDVAAGAAAGAAVSVLCMAAVAAIYQARIEKP